MTVEEMNQKSLNSYVYVEVNDLAKMTKALKTNGADVLQKKDSLEVRNLDSREIGHLASEYGIVIYQPKKVQPTLEELFMEITKVKADYVAHKHERWK